MKKNNAQLIAGIFAIMCGVANAEVFDGIGQPVGKKPSDAAINSSTPLPANHPPMTDPADGSKSAPSSMMQPEGPVKQGKVIEITNGAGYSYLQVESGGAKFWIAGTQVEAKQGDVVSYIENVTMENFTSKTLNKTFDRIVFASSVKVLP